MSCTNEPNAVVRALAMPNENQGRARPAFSVRERDDASRGLPPFDLHHLERLGAAGGDHLDRITLLLANQGAGEGRRDGDALLLGVGFGLADDLPHLLFL